MLFILLQVKHLIIDFIWQPEYEWRNKGTWGHWGGILHAGKHAIATFLILTFFTSIWIALTLAAIEGVLHYLIDYWKMNSNARHGYTPNDPNFWYLLGVDQFLHQLCYGAILAVI